MKDKFEQFKDKLLADIDSGQVTLRPRWKDILSKLFVGLLAIFAFVLTVFIFTFIFFAMREAGALFFLGFGIHGIILFLIIFPWPILALDVLLIIAIVLLSRHFEFGWKTPRLYLAIFTLVAALVASFLIERPFNETIKVHRDALPQPVGRLYRTPPAPAADSGFMRGTVVSITDEEFLVADDRTTEVKNVLFTNREVLREASRLEVGDKVIMAGEDEGGVFKAHGIRHNVMFIKVRYQNQ